MQLRIKTVSVLIGIPIVLWLFYSQLKSDKEINEQYLKKEAIDITGIVTSVDKGDNFHGFGIIRLDLIKSNVEKYDPRSKQEYYFCIVDHNKAEVYDHASSINIGDTMHYNTKFAWGGKINDEADISLNHTQSYYNYIRSHTSFKNLIP